MSAPMLVREIADEDREPLAAILRGTKEFDAEEVEVALELIDHAIAKTDDYQVLVAVQDAVVVGYVCFGPTPMTQGTWDLYWIAAAPWLRRGGVGRALVGALDRTLKAAGARFVRVETSSRDEYALTRAFYDRTDFDLVARIPGFYSEHDDLLIYGRYYRAGSG